MNFTHDQILEMGEGRFFGLGNAQLPNDKMLMVDEITKIATNEGRYGQGVIVASFKILPEHWFFPCHFKNDPVMPGCLGLDALWQLLGVFLGWQGYLGRGRALGVGKVKFSGQIFPDSNEISYRLDVKRLFSRPLPMGIADGQVIQSGKIIYTAENLKVGMISQA